MSSLTESDRAFLEAFRACEMTTATFRHREHLRAAYLHLTLFSYDEALAKLEAGLRRLLAHLGAPASAYHRTLTEAWLRAVQSFMERAGPTADFEQFIKTAPQLLEQKMMEEHYSPAWLGSDAARAAYVEPDRAPIPRHAG